MAILYKMSECLHRLKLTSNLFFSPSEAWGPGDRSAKFINLEVLKVFLFDRIQFKSFQFHLFIFYSSSRWSRSRLGFLLSPLFKADNPKKWHHSEKDDSPVSSLHWLIVSFVPCLQHSEWFVALSSFPPNAAWGNPALKWNMSTYKTN